jgi:hypothetical protein
MPETSGGLQPNGADINNRGQGYVSTPFGGDVDLSMRLSHSPDLIRAGMFR